MDNDDSMFDTIKTLLGILGMVGAGTLAVAKWWDSRKKSQQEARVAREASRTAREDWLIDNAFDIVKGLREELARLREVNEKQGQDLEKCYSRIRELEALIRKHGILNA